MDEMDEAEIIEDLKKDHARASVLALEFVEYCRKNKYPTIQMVMAIEILKSAMDAYQNNVLEQTDEEKLRLSLMVERIQKHLQQNRKP